MKVYLLLIILLIFPSLFGKQDVHEHGRATLNAVMAGKTLQLELIAPSDNFLGFERAPRNKKEERLVKDLLTSLRDADQVIDIPKNNRCRIRKTDIVNPFDEEGHEDEDHDEEEEEHSEFTVIYEFSCASGLTSLEIGLQKLFKAFNNFSKIEVAWSFNNRTGSKDVTAKDHRVTFR